MTKMDASPPHLYVLQKPLTTDRVAIQGVKGSFHDIAARHFFGNQVTVVPALSFEALARLTVEGLTADSAVMAIENTIAGSILSNYNILQYNDLHITGELMLRIRQNLLTLTGTTLGDLREVRSHPVALAQCQDFFKNYPEIRLVESEDTAASAAWVAGEKNPQLGAIGSSLAGDMYGLQILAANIETYQANFTRFLILRSGRFQEVEDANKVSVSMTLPHNPGTLSKALLLLTTLGVNLTKIQSAPLPQHPWEYQFFLDYTHEDRDKLLTSIELLKKEVLNLRVLGVYHTGNTYE